MPHKIVIADDDVHALLLLQLNLQKEGHDVIPTRNGQEAWEKTLEEKPDLVILDVMMPLMDGWEVLSAIRKNPDTSEQLVILLTALAGNHDMIRGLSRGADLYISKPYEPLEMIMLVDRLLQAQDLGLDPGGEVEQEQE